MERETINDHTIGLILRAESHFDVLSLPMPYYDCHQRRQMWNCDTDAVNKAFRKLSLSCHPDKSVHPDAGKAFDLLKKAKACLVHPLERDRYIREFLSRHWRATVVTRPSAKAPTPCSSTQKQKPSPMPDEDGDSVVDTIMRERDEIKQRHRAEMQARRERAEAAAEEQERARSQPALRGGRRALFGVGSMPRLQSREVRAKHGGWKRMGNDDDDESKLSPLSRPPMPFKMPAGVRANVFETLSFERPRFPLQRPPRTRLGSTELDTASDFAGSAPPKVAAFELEQAFSHSPRWCSRVKNIVCRMCMFVIWLLVIVGSTAGLLLSLEETPSPQRPLARIMHTPPAPPMPIHIYPRHRPPLAGLGLPPPSPPLRPPLPLSPSFILGPLRPPHSLPSAPPPSPPESPLMHTYNITS